MRLADIECKNYFNLYMFCSVLAVIQCKQTFRMLFYLAQAAQCQHDRLYTTLEGGAQAVMLTRRNIVCSIRSVQGEEVIVTSDQSALWLSASATCGGPWLPVEWGVRCKLLYSWLRNVSWPADYPKTHPATVLLPLCLSLFNINIFSCTPIKGTNIHVHTI